jgi:hypothetical protein
VTKDAAQPFRRATRRLRLTVARTTLSRRALRRGVPVRVRATRAGTVRLTVRERGGRVLAVRTVRFRHSGARVVRLRVRGTAARTLVMGARQRRATARLVLRVMTRPS